MGKAALEPQILEEINEYAQHFIEPNLNRPINMHKSLPQASANIISQLLFGRRFDYDDAIFNELLNTLEKQVGLFAKLSILENIPFSGIILSSQVKVITDLVTKYAKPALQSYVEECRAKMDTDDPQSMVERFLVSESTISSDSGKTS